ncbi:SprB repeat-containing protein, partial [Bacteroidales bacterium AH-315-I05]|nr:SprB repeat-containing protein [Bacteroidales bacterium AH-315-I05]
PAITTIWYDDFSDTSIWLISAPAPNGWEITSSNTGWYFGASINSTSGGNYAIFENGDPTPGGVPVPVNGAFSITTLNSIDLTTENDVWLTFEQYTATFQDMMEVQISLDGAIFTAVGDNSDIPALTSTGGSPTSNPMLRSYNISSIAGGQQKVWIRFEWRDDLQNITYCWMIDDIKLTRPPDNELVVLDAFYNTSFDSTFTKYYSKTPQRQAQQDTLLFGCSVNNNGYADQPNTKLDVSVSGAVTYAVSSSSTTLLQGSSTSFDIATQFKPSVIGTYNVDFDVNSDSVDYDITNNIISHQFDVTDTVYARDDGNYTGWGGWNGTGNLYQMGNLFEIFTTDTATSISVYFQTNTDSSTVVNVNLLDAGFNLIATGNFYTLNGADIGTWITIPLPETELIPGAYIAAIETFATDVLVSINPDAAPPLTSFLYDPGQSDWFYLPNIPFIRMNTKQYQDVCNSFSVNPTNITNVSCSGMNDGAVDIVVSGGNSPFTYIWNSGATTEDLSGLAGGAYIVTATDNLGCEAFGGQYTVVDPDSIGINSAITDISCFGQTDGQISLSPSGGAAPFTYLWSNGSTGATIFGLTDTVSYSVTVTDANSCTNNIGNLSVNEPAELISAVSSITNVTCGQNNGGATVSHSGGTSPFIYSWDSGENTAVADSLPMGSNNITVTDASGCMDVVSFTIGGTPAVAISISTNESSCTVDDGDATANITNGTSPYTYQWDAAAGNQTSVTATGLGQGSYSVIVTDANSCSDTTVATVTNINAPILSTSTTNVACKGESTGAVNLTITSGGTPPFSYNWDNGATSEDISNLSVGTYSVTVTDASTCVSIYSATITEPADSLIITPTNTNLQCNGYSNAQASVTVTGGSTPYSYLWTPGGQTTSSIFGLGGGTYSVFVTDFTNCTQTVTITVNEPTAIGITGTVVDNQPVGSIDITVTGGTSPYTYSWSSGEVIEDLNNITTQGPYTVTVTDANGCSDTQTFTVGGLVSISKVKVQSSEFKVYPNPNKG